MLGSNQLCPQQVHTHDRGAESYRQCRTGQQYPFSHLYDPSRLHGSRESRCISSAECFIALVINSAETVQRTVEMNRPHHLLYRWLGTAFLTALLISTVKIYQAKGNFTSTHKTAFMTIMLALMLNLFVRTPCAQ